MYRRFLPTRWQMNNLWICLRGISEHWIGIASGSTVSLGILIYEKWNEKPVRWRIIVGIFFLGLLASLFFAWQDQYTSAEWRGGEIKRLSGEVSAKNEEIKRLNGTISQKDRPIILQTSVDPQLKKLLVQQEVALEKLKNQIPSPKKRALQLSSDILKFLGEREKIQPVFPEPPAVSPGMSMDTYRQLSQQKNAEYDRTCDSWMNTIRADYKSQFSVRIIQTLEDFKNVGLEDPSQGLCWWGGNLFAIQACGAKIGLYAEKLSP